MKDTEYMELVALRQENARREKEYVAKLIEEVGEWLDEDELFERAPGCDLAALCGVEIEGLRCYPGFLLTADGEVLPGLMQVLAALPACEAWTRIDFVLAPHPGLCGRSPLEVLQALSRGQRLDGIDMARLVKTASLEWEHGAW